MITEDYVSFEVAKLLKEKGFNEPCNAYWFHMIDTEPIFNGDMPRQVYNNKSDTIEIICCPTFQMAIKWLREVYDIDISIIPLRSHKEYLPRIESDTISHDAIPCKKYEAAEEVAIKYCLENLI